MVRFSRFSHSFSKPTTTYINSPLTGTQIDVDYWIEDHDKPLAYIEIKIPLASATAGHNLIHAGLESILQETKCAALIARITLAVLGFTPAEVDQFIRQAETTLLELTWHTKTASGRAKLNLLARTKDHFDAQYSIKVRHDVAVSNMYYMEGNGNPGLLVEFKGGDGFRQYGKAAQAQSRTKRDRKKSRVEKPAQRFRQALLDAIEHDVRNELLVGRQTLAELGLLNPSSWNAENLKGLIDHVWAKMGFHSHREGDAGESLSPEAVDTWRRHCNGEDMQKVLPAYTFSRHRGAIKAAKGEDIALEKKWRHVSPKNLGHQLCYGRRWKPSGDIGNMIVGSEAGPAIIEELKRGLAFIESGELPDFDDMAEQAAWLKKWREFMEAEGGRKSLPSQAPEMPHRQLLPPKRRNSHLFKGGIGSVRVPIGVIDQLIFVDNEWRVV